MHHKAIIEPDLFTLYSLAFNPSLYTLLAFGLHILEEIFKVGKMVVSDMLFSLLIDLCDEDAVREISASCSVHARHNLRTRMNTHNL